MFHFIIFLILSPVLHGFKIAKTLNTQKKLVVHKQSFRLSSSIVEETELVNSDYDFVVVGSGIGGLSSAALLAYYGYKVAVFESHYLAGGCAHTFEHKGFFFDAGPSLWNGMDSKPYNPLRELLNVIGEGDSVKYAHYDGWVMHTPDGTFKFTVGKDKFNDVIKKYGGPNALKEWEELNKALIPIQELSTAIPPLVLRNDAGVGLTLFPHLWKLMKGGLVASKVEGSFSDVLKPVVKDVFLYHWFDFLSFALSGLPADATIAAAVAYTMRDLHQEGAKLDYPIGGSAAVVEALIRGFEKKGGKLFLSSPVERIIVKNGQAIGIELKKPLKKDGKKKIIPKKGKVISNASIWDTMKLIEKSYKTETKEPDPSLKTPENIQEYIDKNLKTPRTGSFVHLHIGINATGLPNDLESHYSVINNWDPIDAPQNHVIISIPTVLDPMLAPEGCHVIHAYAAANEPYELWENRKMNKTEYEQFKRERCKFLWEAIERSIPDVRDRVIVELEASPFTHERFNRRYKGTFGPAYRAGKEKFPFPKSEVVDGLYLCGDSIFPGIGVPAVAMSGANAASSCVSVFEHLKMLDRFYELQKE